MTFINLQAAIDRYGVSKRTLYYWIKFGRIEGRRTKYGAMVHVADVEREIAAAKENPLRNHIGPQPKRKAEA